MLLGLPGNPLSAYLNTLLFLPVVAPVLLAATKAWDAALAGTPSHAGGWLDVLVVFAVLYIAIGTVAFGPLLEDG